MVIAAVLFGVNIYGVTQLEQDFDYRWFIPSDSYAWDYFDAIDEFFPDNGLFVNVYLGKHCTYMELMVSKHSDSEQMILFILVKFKSQHVDWSSTVQRVGCQLSGSNLRFSRPSVNLVTITVAAQHNMQPLAGHIVLCRRSGLLQQTH